jgi:hypothetical protein
MKTITKVKNYAFPPEVIFPLLDDLGVTGMHMTKSSMMMGSKLHLNFLSANTHGPDTKYHWSGKMMGMKMDFTVAVTKWIGNREKTWETIGPAKLIIYSCYRMHLLVDKVPTGSRAELSISYERPKGFFYKILSYFLADWYCRWCLNHMLNDAEKASNKIYNKSLAA